MSKVHRSRLVHPKCIDPGWSKVHRSRLVQSASIQVVFGVEAPGAPGIIEHEWVAVEAVREGAAVTQVTWAHASGAKGDATWVPLAASCGGKDRG